MAELKKVARIGDVPKGSMKAFELGHRRFVICNTGDGIYAVADECSHDSAPISDGELQGEEVVCQRHGARFSVRDGSVKGPPAVVPIDSYEVKIEGQDIYVLLD